MSARQSLSVCLVTYAAAGPLRRFLLAALDYADELVVTLDSRCSKETVAVAVELADSVAVADLDGLAERAQGWTAERARGDWILALDDDEIMAPGFGDRLPELLAGRYSHYHLPVRWVVWGPGGSPQWLRQFPWYPNQATRLFRNVSGTFHHPARLHSVWQVAGDGRSLQNPDVAIYHLNLLEMKRTDRERKVVTQYRPLAADELPTCEEYYLFEDYVETLEFGSVPEALARRVVDGSGAAPRRAPRGSPPPLRLDSSELAAHIAERSEDPPIWSAEYLSHTTPERWFTNRGCTVEVTVRNTSEATWGSSGQTAGRVVLSYRWRDQDGVIVVPQGDVALLPRPCLPGEVVSFEAGVWTPSEAGRYILEWEMLCERVGWFSDRGVAPLSTEVEIEERGPRPAAPHFPAPPPIAREPGTPELQATEALVRRRSGPLLRLRRRWLT
jgi:hypothetical protein